MARARRRTSADEPGAQTLTGPDEGSRQRLQLDFSPEAFARLEEIKRLSDARTNAEVVRNALRVYEWFLRQKKAEYELHLVKGDTVKEVELVF